MTSRVSPFLASFAPRACTHRGRAWSRTLVDLGIMRDQGEGIPRMFAEMEGSFLPLPNIEARPREFIVTLRNTPTLTEADKGNPRIGGGSTERSSGLWPRWDPDRERPHFGKRSSN